MHCWPLPGALQLFAPGPLPSPQPLALGRLRALKEASRKSASIKTANTLYLNVPQIQNLGTQYGGPSPNERLTQDAATPLLGIASTEGRVHDGCVDARARSGATHGSTHLAATRWLLAHATALGLEEEGRSDTGYDVHAREGHHAEGNECRKRTNAEWFQVHEAPRGVEFVGTEGGRVGARGRKGELFHGDRVRLGRRRVLVAVTVRHWGSVLFVTHGTLSVD